MSTLLKTSLSWLLKTHIFWGGKHNFPQENPFEFVVFTVYWAVLCIGRAILIKLNTMYYYNINHYYNITSHRPLRCHWQWVANRRRDRSLPSTSLVNPFSVGDWPMVIFLSIPRLGESIVNLSSVPRSKLSLSLFKRLSPSMVGHSVSEVIEWGHSKVLYVRISAFWSPWVETITIRN